jgi:hypothetical protein
VALLNKSNPKRNLSRLLTGRFLTIEQWEKNWPVLTFISLLALIMISSSHLADEKTHRISEMRERVKELSSEYIELHSHLMSESLESKVLLRAEEELKLIKGSEPPILLKAEAEKE